MRYVFFLIVAFLSACTFSDGLYVCETEGETRPGAVCRGGFWLATGVTDGGTDVGNGETDVTISTDAAGGDTGSDAGCVPRENDVLCVEGGFQCGTPTVTECGVEITLDCPDCTGDAKCGEATPFVCGCDDVGLCRAAGAQCGEIPAPDGCGVATITCDPCGGSGVCDDDANICECPAGYEYDGTDCVDIDECLDPAPVSYTHLTLPTTPYV